MSDMTSEALSSRGSKYFALSEPMIANEKRLRVVRNGLPLQSSRLLLVAVWKLHLIYKISSGRCGKANSNIDT